MATTEENLRALALAYAAGHVYTTQDVPKDLWHCVFMPLTFATDEQLDGIVMAVGNTATDQMSGQGINGYPIFYSCRFFDKPTAERFIQLCDEARAAAAAFLNPETK